VERDYPDRDFIDSGLLEGLMRDAHGIDADEPTGLPFVCLLASKSAESSSNAPV
jgi:hypothetical protein